MSNIIKTELVMPNVGANDNEIKIVKFSEKKRELYFN